MKKGLLVWNIVLSVVLMVLIFGGCSNTQVTNLANQVEANRAAIEQLNVTISQQAQLIQSQSAQIATLQTYINSSIQQLQAQTQLYVQQYVQTYAVTK